MPEWFLPVEESSMSFQVSENLYNKFLGLALCFVLNKNEQKEQFPLEIEPYVNGQRRNNILWRPDLLDLDHIWLQLYTPFQMFGAIDFDQIDESYIQFRLDVMGENVEKWGLRMICKPLEDDLTVGIQDNQLMDLALLYEVGHNSTDFEVESSHMHEVNPTQTDLQKVLQDCQMSTDKHSPMASERNHELFSIEACEQRPRGLLIQLAEMSIAALARCFCS